MLELIWSMVGIIVGLCVAVLAVTLVVWAIMAIGVNVLSQLGEANVQIKWIERMFKD